MSDPLAAAFAQTDSGILYPAQARTEVFPWSDLGALNPPTGYINISHELIAALSVLVGQAQSQPRLIRATEDGSLNVAEVSAAATVLTDVALPGATVLSVLDSSRFHVGQTFQLRDVHGGNPDCNGLDVREIPDSKHIRCQGTCGGITYQPGDAVTATSVVVVGNQITAGLASFDQLNTWPGGTLSPDNALSVNVDPVGRQLLRTDATRPYDLWLWSQLQINAAASVTFAAPGAGRRLQLAYVSAGMWASSIGGIDQLQVWKNGIGVGTQLFETMLSVPAANTGDRYLDDSIRLVGDDNGSLSVTMNLVAASVRHEVQAGVFILKQ